MRLTVAGTKNRQPLRLALVGETRAMVKRRLDEVPYSASRVFAGPRGGSAEMSIRREFPRALKAAGFPCGRSERDGVTWHALRSCFAVAALQANLPASLVKQMGKWKSSQAMARHERFAASAVVAGARALDAHFSASSHGTPTRASGEVVG